MLHDVGNPTDVARHYRHAVAHRLEQHDAESFGVAAGIENRRQHQRVRRRIGRAEFVV